MRVLTALAVFTLSLAANLPQGFAQQQDETPFDSRRRAYLESLNQAQDTMDARRARHLDVIMGKTGDATNATADAGGGTAQPDMAEPAAQGVPWMPDPKNVGVGLPDAQDKAPARPGEPVPVGSPDDAVTPQNTEGPAAYDDDD